MKHTIRTRYVNFIERQAYGFGGFLFFSFLYLLSLVYGLIIHVRNYCYNHRLLPVHILDKKIISVGNLSWGGSGKTSLVMYLHQRLRDRYCVASVTKGYAADEYLMLKSALGDVLDGRRRVNLIKKNEAGFDLFILDDGFQYRKLARTVDIVMLQARDAQKPFLLPAYMLREPFSSLSRADIIIIHGKEGTHETGVIQKKLSQVKPPAKMYYAEYVFKQIGDRNRKHIAVDYFKGKKIAALTGIGYPNGFFDGIRSIGITLADTIIYPDHYFCDTAEMDRIETALTARGIKDVIITHKDFFHLALDKTHLNYFIFEVELKISDEQSFLSELYRLLEKK